MIELLFFLFALAIIVVIWAAIGHLLWVMIAWTVRQLSGHGETAVPSIQPRWECLRCHSLHAHSLTFCDRCHSLRPTDEQLDQLKDLAATERQLRNFVKRDRLSLVESEKLMMLIEQDHEQITPTKAQPSVVQSAPISTEARNEPVSVVPPVINATVAVEETPATPTPTVPKDLEPIIIEQPRPPRRSFSEVLNTF